MFELPFDIEPGEPVFVLSMTYRSGDSFGSSTGNMDVIWVFKDAKVAAKAKSIWQKCCDGNDPTLGFDDRYSVKFPKETGDVITLCNPAAGYFERLEYLDLTTFLLNP